MDHLKIIKSLAPVFFIDYDIEKTRISQTHKTVKTLLRKGLIVLLFCYKK